MNAKQRRSLNRKFKHRVLIRPMGWEEKQVKCDWLNRHFKGKWRMLEWGQWGFAKEADATFFKLKWL